MNLSDGMTSHRIIEFQTFGRYMSSKIEVDWADRVVPGQFLMARVGRETERLLGRPFCISDCNRGWVQFVAAIVGDGTRIMSETFKAGDNIEILGPLGNGFSIPNDCKEVILIGGGIGIAEIFLLAKHLDAKGCKALVIGGARTAEDLVFHDRLMEHSRELIVTTEDGSLGTKGLATEPLKEILAQGFGDMIVSCGPMPMLKAVARIARDANIRSLIATEERMACGIGACYGCTIPIDTPDGIKMLRVCKEGPVFKGSAFLEGQENA